MKKRQAELASLGEWKHINCRDSAAKTEIIDEALKSIAYTSPDIAGELDQVDVEAHSLPDGVPGGSVCFLFEKTSSTSESPPGS